MADDIIPLRSSYALSMVERITELEAEIERLRSLITQVLDCPTNHRGRRSAVDSVVQYTAKRIDNSLLDALKQEARNA